ncbi:Uncharacterized protein TPAR_07273 [Tolypocladium paradoxum]|uniref:Uncharacterized protein n=1 Tax=Tolypocladium paradoxum TaxID=94208 RepID=A0A2S4KQN1_9HYPO|nr:Uncharacterized protein TPAR_07273 [Tolypocladium paradoxum]
MSAIPVDELGTELFRDTLSSPQLPTPVAASSTHNQGRSPAEVQQEFIRLWNRKKEENDMLESMNAPDAAALEALRSSGSIHDRRPAPSTPQGENALDTPGPAMDFDTSVEAYVRSSPEILGGNARVRHVVEIASPTPADSERNVEMDDNDMDSSYEDEFSSASTSLRSSIMKYEWKHGRRYHSY